MAKIKEIKKINSNLSKALFNVFKKMIMLL